jgi:deoxyribodipyrimidine photo-lyase
MTALVWLRKDLRLSDNPAWNAAMSNHDRVQAVFVLEPILWAASGRHRIQHLVASLRALDRSLGRLGGRLLVVDGPGTTAVPRLAAHAEGVYWNADYSAFSRDRDDRVRRALAVPVSAYHGTLVHEPGRITTEAGSPYRVFTPFWRRWQTTPWQTWPAPGAAEIADAVGVGIPDAAEPFGHEPGERGAADRLHTFLDVVDRYEQDRDLPDVDGTSRLSIDMKFGTISPRLVATEIGTSTPGREAFVRQLAWRDFHAHVLAAFPAGFESALRPEYDVVRWRDDPRGFTAWQSGSTGYPIVDAGMRQLRAEGWMHNRVRLITASFLVKDLLVDWRRGERHFRRLLADADPTQNVGNWQWVAGTGFDAAPYFRIINPVTQSVRHDPEGGYIRKWVPELGALAAPAVHAPWEHPEALAAAGITLGKDYPAPIVDHGRARERTLDAYRAARGG